MKTTEQIGKVMGSIDSIKIYGANAVAFLSTFTAIDAFLKIALLVATIVYTITKTVILIKKNHEMDHEIKGDKEETE